MEQGLDLIIYVVDPTREIGDEERAIMGMIKHINLPKLLVINKSDLPFKNRKYQTDYELWSNDFDDVFRLSALRASHIEPLRQKVIELMPEGEAMYNTEQLTNIDNFFWVEEIIREKTFSVFDKEIPYSIAVEVEDIEDKKDIMVIKAKILTNEDRYKKIIIGQRGGKIKEIGKMARRELEQAINKKIFLELEVEVDKHWVERI